MVKVLDDYQIVGDFMDVQGIYSPMIRWQVDGVGDPATLEITIDGLDAEDIERLDVITIND